MKTDQLRPFRSAERKSSSITASPSTRRNVFVPLFPLPTSASHSPSQKSKSSGPAIPTVRVSAVMSAGTARATRAFSERGRSARGALVLLLRQVLRVVRGEPSCEVARELRRSGGESGESHAPGRLLPGALRLLDLRDLGAELLAEAFPRAPLQLLEVAAEVLDDPLDLRVRALRARIAHALRDGRAAERSHGAEGAEDGGGLPPHERGGVQVRLRARDQRVDITVDRAAQLA